MNTRVHLLDCEERGGLNPKRHTRRRRMSVGDYQARKFWEGCVIAIFAKPAGVSAIENADRALIAWRERWEKEPPKFYCPDPVPEAGPVVSPFTSDRNPTTEEQETDWHLSPPGRFDSEDFRSPVESAGGFRNFHVHRFAPVTGNRYCGLCGGGKLHSIHRENSRGYFTGDDKKYIPIPPQERGKTILRDSLGAGIDPPQNEQQKTPSPANGARVQHPAALKQEKCRTCGVPLNYHLDCVLQDQCYKCAKSELKEPKS